MRSRLLVGSALLFVALFAPTLPAGADPIVITSGTIVQPGRPAGIGSGDLVGTQNFTWVGQIDLFSGFGDQCELRCSPGVTLDMGGRLLGSSAKGEVTYLDQQFRIGGSTPSFGVLNMNFTAEPFVLPPAGSSATFTTPFMMSGQLLFPFFGPPAQPSVPLSGSGFATALFIPSTAGVAPGWQLSQVTYEFVSEPVPEPSTMLLVGGGVAALLRRRFRSKRTA